MIEGGDRPMLGFETLTFCPIDRRLVVADLLTDDELRWLNDYHAETRDKLLPLIADADVATWLKRATAPLS
jgi:Xaa-Pro aminopeptidase